MNAGRFFQLLKSMPAGDWRTLTGEMPFVVLSPHPDDESLGAGGLIALSRQNGLDVSVVLLTDGSMSHPNSRTYPRERLVATRRAELIHAAGILDVGPDHLFELGQPDAAAPSAGPEFERAVDAVGAIIEGMGARSVFATWEHDPHCDHEAAARLGRVLRKRYSPLRLWSYPVWGWHLVPTHSISSPAPAGFRLDIGEVLEQKRAAIGAHVSQMTDLIEDDPDGFRFDERSLKPFLQPYEFFIEVPAE